MAKLSHLGADIDPDIVDQFRKQAKEDGLKQKNILRALVLHWLSLPLNAKNRIYHYRGK